MEIVDQAPKRSTFLTVICVLTFIGSGLGLWDAVMDYLSADFAGQVASQALEEVQDKLDQEKDVPGFMGSLLGSVREGMNPANLRKLGMVEGIANALTLAGALLMWRLRRSGFWLYTGGIVVLVAGQLVIFGNGLIGLAAAGIIGFFGILFIVAYALNLRQMR